MNMERAWIPAGVRPAERRRLFAIWIRTGRIPTRRDDGVELKFNPRHDPRDGRFTSGPGGEAASRDGPPERVSEGGGVGAGGDVVRSDGVYRPDEPGAKLIPIGAPEPPETRGGNIRAFEDPMILDELPILRNSPLGALLAPVDGFLDITGPGAEIRTALMRVQADKILADIQAIDPQFVFHSFQFPSTEQGQRNLIDGLRFDRAVAIMRATGDLRPLQVETMRLTQRTADEAYDEGLRLLNLSSLPVRLNDQEALGTFVDKQVRNHLREKFNQEGVKYVGVGAVRVNRNERIGTDGRFRRPDARVGDVAFEVSLTGKTSKTPQISGFFEANFHPSAVVLIRPSKVGPSYIIRRSR